MVAISELNQIWTTHRTTSTVSGLYSVEWLMSRRRRKSGRERENETERSKGKARKLLQATTIRHLFTAAKYN